MTKPASNTRQQKAEEKLRRLEAKWKRIALKASIRFAVFKKPFAVSLIVFLAIADFYALSMLFDALDAAVIDRTVYSLSFVVCLEGLPTFLGICASQLSDRTNYKKNDRLYALVGTIVGAVGLFFAFGLAWYVRNIQIERFGGYEAFLAGEYGKNATSHFWEAEMNNEYIKDIFLQYSPIMTSLLAFVVSWVTFPSNSHKQLERDLDTLQLQYLDKLNEFNVARNTLEVARVSLWKDLATGDTNMPRSYNAFRKECYIRIRGLVYENIMERYPNQIEKYNNDMENVLKQLISDMQKHTTMPESISAIKLDELLKEYDQTETKDINKWDSDTAVTPMLDQLKHLLSNAVVVAQFKSTSGPTFREGNRW